MLTIVRRDVMNQQCDLLIRNARIFDPVLGLDERGDIAVTDIPLCLENPKIGRAYDAEVVSDRIAEDRPVFRYLLAQEM